LGFTLNGIDLANRPIFSASLSRSRSEGPCVRIYHIVFFL
jgi:hypothetical protein